MDYNTLLDLATDLGYHLAMSGAETFRVEDSVSRVLTAYDIQSEVFAIPNCLPVSIEAHAGQPGIQTLAVQFAPRSLPPQKPFNG